MRDCDIEALGSHMMAGTSVYLRKYTGFVSKAESMKKKQKENESEEGKG
jgi:hypothetical protein